MTDRFRTATTLLRQFRLIPVVLLLLLFLAPPLQGAAATDRLKNIARRYYYGLGVEQDYRTALRLYLQAAGKGDTEAQYIAGGMYYKGLGTPVNMDRAFSLLYGAAVAGSSTPESQKLLGQFFLQGTTIPQNLGEAMKWYRQAAENGDAEAQSELAFLYFTGRAGEKDPDKALYWYEQAARQGLAVAQYSLGIMHLTGSGLDSADPVGAYGWISLAASQNFSDAIYARNYLTTILSAEELQRAQDMSLRLFEEIGQAVP